MPQTNAPNPTPEELIALDIDLRLIWLYQQLWDGRELELDVLPPYVRYAYYSGYWDAFTENRRGKLFVDHGQRIPPRPKGQHVYESTDP